MSTCCVLLSTYNGEKFLQEQLESILLQKTQSKLMIYIRDDGSDDSTAEVVRQLIKEHPEIKIIFKEQENIGVQRSFLQLMRSAPKADYYAFCDQDDYWKSGKIEAAIRRLEKCNNKPAVYYSNFDIVDSELMTIGTSRIVECGVTYSLTQILFQNRVPGCTMVFNESLLRIINSADIEMVRMHDAYVLAIAYIVGEVVGDNIPRIMYRQHENNTVGYRKHFPGIKRWITEKMKLIKKGENYSMAKMAEEIMKSCSSMCNEKQLLELQRIVNYPRKLEDRMRLLCSSQTVSTTNFRSTISVKCKILLRLM